MRTAVVAVLIVVSVSICANAKDKDGIGPQTDFRTIPPEQILTLLQNADSIRVDAKGLGLRLEGGDKNFEAGCNGKAGWAGEGACSQLLSSFLFSGTGWTNRSNSEIAFAMEALLRGCGLYARSPDMAAGGKTCVELGEVLNAIGNSAAAATVWQQAPGCVSSDDSGPVNGCVVYAILSARSVYASDPIRLERMAKTSCDTLHDRTACEYLRSLGESVNMNAVARADADRQEARQEAREQRAANLAQEQNDAEARRDALFSALKIQPGASDPNAVLNAGTSKLLRCAPSAMHMRPGSKRIPKTVLRRRGRRPTLTEPPMVPLAVVSRIPEPVRPAQAFHRKISCRPLQRFPNASQSKPRAMAPTPSPTSAPMQ